jgi:hypothetical protein
MSNLDQRARDHVGHFKTMFGQDGQLIVVRGHDEVDVDEVLVAQ